MARLYLVFSLFSLAVSPLFSAFFWLIALLGKPHPQQQTPFKSPQKTPKPLLSLAISWLFLSLLTGLLSDHPVWHLSGLLSRYGLTGLLFWMTYRALKTRRFQTQHFFQGLILASFMLAVIGLGNTFMDWELSQNWLCIPGFDSSCLLNFNLSKSDRAQSLAMHPNILGTLLCLSLPLWLWLLNTAKGLLKLPVFLGLFPILLCLLMTYSRAAWLATIPALILGGLYLLNASWRTVLWSSLCVGVLPLILSSSNLFARLFSILKPGEGSSGTRLVIWQTGWQILQDVPFLGTGLLHVEKYYLLYRPQPVEAAHLHNIYLQVAVESGILSALILFGSLLYALRAPPLSKAGQAAWLSWFSLGLISTVDCTILDLRVAWFAMVLLAIIVFERQLISQVKALETMLGSKQQKPSPFIDPTTL